MITFFKKGRATIYAVACEHALTAQEIIAKLSDYSVNAERRTLYKDLAMLEQYGMDIITNLEINLLTSYKRSLLSST